MTQQPQQSSTRTSTSLGVKISNWQALASIVMTTTFNSRSTTVKKTTLSGCLRHETKATKTMKYWPGQTTSISRSRSELPLRAVADPTSQAKRASSSRRKCRPWQRENSPCSCNSQWRGHSAYQVTAVRLATPRLLNSHSSKQLKPTKAPLHLKASPHKRPSRAKIS